MKRILLLAVALCSMSLFSCDNDQDQIELSPEELEIIKLEELIASQTDFDEDALIADLCKGSLKTDSEYYYKDGHFENERPISDGRVIARIFFADGTCRACCCVYPTGKLEYIYSPYYWRYDSATRSIITKYKYGDFNEDGELIYPEHSEKVLYYDAETHRLILEEEFGDDRRYYEKVRSSCYIDVDESERTRILELCSSEI